MNIGSIDIPPASFWWVLTGAAIVAELLTGTVYLLLVGGGFAAAAIAAHLGVSSTAQIVVAAAVGAGAVLLWRQLGEPRIRARRGKADALDIGEIVEVTAWNADGTAQVRYRGAGWTALAQPGSAWVSGQHRVVDIVGSRLVVVPA